MPEFWPLLLVGMGAVALLLWSLASRRPQRGDRKLALERLGFRPCPERRSWLEDTVTRLEHTEGYRFEIREPRRLSGEPEVYYYIKGRTQPAYPDSIPVAEEEFLFSPGRPAAGPVVLTLKPPSVPVGAASRMMGAIATVPWDSQPDDLQRLDLPPALEHSSLVGALGPRNTRLEELLDSGILGVLPALADAGATFVRFRDGWCTVSSASSLIPFHPQKVVAAIRPLL